MIKIRDLKYCFKEYEFEINCQNLTADTGTSIGVYGKTASGKTLFSQIVSGVIRNYSGSVEIGMTELRSTYRKKIGYLPFRNILYNEMTVKEMSLFLLSQYKVAPSEFELKLKWFSQFCEINSLISRKIFSLSDGELQYIKYFSALIHSPSVLIIDEPFNGLGDDNVVFIKSLLEDINSREVTVLAVSSHKDLLTKISGRIYTVSEGKIE